MNVIVQKHSGVFFIDGPGGTGKTFLYRTLMASLRSRGEIVLATASSGIAATLLPGGRTAHSRFKIPIDIQPSSNCAIQKKKDLANLIRVVVAIIWDEAPMTNKNCLEALDRSLQDICSNSAPFGGKVLIMGEDFRQVLPVIRKVLRHKLFQRVLFSLIYGIIPRFCICVKICDHCMIKSLQNFLFALVMVSNLPNQMTW